MHATQISKWKKQALEYLQAVFSNKLQRSELVQDELYRQVGQLKVENDFLKKNVICLCKDRRQLLEPNHTKLSLRDQCQLLDINRSSYYEPRQGITTRPWQTKSQ